MLGATDHNEVHVGGESSVETVKQLCQVSINFSFICLWRAFMLLVLEQRHRSDRGPRTEDELELVWIFLRQSSSFAGRSSYPVPPGS